ncbi:MAG: PA0069 family radical SAM protein [Leptospiraceae bacterium]|nr:PA0069 family radical SAM protein [Leptospiraceae bacterium]MCP5496622.1 PA0069 family radical SAM protein [Leptospiraceae bacterium]
MDKRTYRLNRRGALSNVVGRFETIDYESFDDGWDLPEDAKRIPTTVYKETAKSVITHNDSPDVPFEQGLNPYRGCEHGCIYCYARPNHGYVNLSPGIDFETKIFAKTNAAEILEKEISKPTYKCKTIAIGSATDPYQPSERTMGITRSVLEVLNKYKHPVGIITKSNLILRDIDLLSQMAKENLVSVAVSIGTLDKELAAIMEPRAPTPQKRLEAVQRLTKQGIPVGVMSAPMIPALNDYELEFILQAASYYGAISAGYVLVRLPYEVKELFQEWLGEHFPLKSKHIMNLIRSTREGKENNSDFGSRMIGSGNYAELLKKRFLLAKKRYGLDKEVKLDKTKFIRKGQSQQLSLFCKE